MATIVCFDCGTVRERVPRNTRYCVDCRILRDIAHFTQAGKTCESDGCTRSFVPTNRGDAYCGPCTPGKHWQRGRCSLCATDDTLLEWPGVAVCKRCVREPGQRAKVIRGLVKRQEQRLAANAGGPPPGVLEESKSRRRAPDEQPAAPTEDVPEI